MKWTVDLAEGSSVSLVWEAGRLASENPDLVALVERYAETEETCSPIPGTLYPTGLASPTDAWATVTCALTETFEAVTTPEPPVPMPSVADGRVY